MKLTKSKLKQLIKEELQNVFLEQNNRNCGQKPSLPPGWQNLPKNDKRRVAFRAWYCCTHPTRRGCDAVNKQNQQQQAQNWKDIGSGVKKALTKLEPNWQTEMNTHGYEFAFEYAKAVKTPDGYTIPMSVTTEDD